MTIHDFSPTESVMNVRVTRSEKTQRTTLVAVSRGVASTLALTDEQAALVGRGVLWAIPTAALIEELEKRPDGEVVANPEWEFLYTARISGAKVAVLAYNGRTKELVVSMWDDLRIITAGGSPRYRRYVDVPPEVFHTAKLGDVDHYYEASIVRKFPSMSTTEFPQRIARLG